MHPRGRLRGLSLFPVKKFNNYALEYLVQIYIFVIINHFFGNLLQIIESKKLNFLRAMFEFKTLLNINYKKKMLHV